MQHGEAHALEMAVYFCGRQWLWLLLEPLQNCDFTGVQDFCFVLSPHG
jgi:hypothetical protein